MLTLWLSGLMGLLAVGAFTLLWFLPLGRRDEEEPEDTSGIALITADLSPVTGVGAKAAAEDAKPPFEDSETSVEYAEIPAEEDVSYEEDVSCEAEEEDMPSVEVLTDRSSDDEEHGVARDEDDGAADEDAPDDCETDDCDTIARILARGAAESGFDEAAISAAPDAAAGTDDAADALSDREDRSEEDETDWFLAGTGSTEFKEFDPEEEDLVVVWDDSLGIEPSVQVVRNEADPDLACIVMGDTILAQIRTKADMRADHVSLIPLSAARSLGWAHP